MAKDVLIKGVDPDVYRRAKAAAALGGLSMGEAVSAALAAWTKGVEGLESEREYLRDLEWVRREWGRIARHRGKAVVVSAEKLQGVFDSYEPACKFASRFRVALTFVVGDRPGERQVDIGPDLEIQ